MRRTSHSAWKHGYEQKNVLYSARGAIGSPHHRQRLALVLRRRTMLCPVRKDAKATQHHGNHPTSECFEQLHMINSFTRGGTVIPNPWRKASVSFRYSRWQSLQRSMSHPLSMVSPHVRTELTCMSTDSTWKHLTMGASYSELKWRAVVHIPSSLAPHRSHTMVLVVLMASTLQIDHTLN